MADVKKFLAAYFSNGQLQIYDSESGVLLSRKDAFLPVNMWLNHEAAEADIQAWTKLADERRLANTGPRDSQIR
jgi:hypothetical protein